MKFKHHLRDGLWMSAFIASILLTSEVALATPTVRVPEPTSLSLIAVGVGAAWLIDRVRRRK